MKEWGENTQQLIAFKIFRNRKRAKGRKAKKKGWEQGMQVTDGGVEGLNVINDPKCNKVLNVTITFCRKCNKFLNVITICPKCYKLFISCQLQ